MPRKEGEITNTNQTPSKTAKTTRRTFLETGSVALLGLSLPRGGRAARGSNESLAISGGAPAVTFPHDRFETIVKWPRYGEEEKRTVGQLLEHNGFYEEIQALEKEMKEYLHAPYVKAHMNGTSALMSMFFALNLPPGSEILAPSYTAWATTAPMWIFGYVPAFVDTSPRTMTFDLEYAKKCLNRWTKAVLPMHTFGNPCDMDEICDFAKEYGLIVLEDAAQAEGAWLKGKPMGRWSSIGIFSFQASKMLPSIEGGMGIYETREYL